MKSLKIAAWMVAILILPFLQSCMDDDDNESYLWTLATVKVIDGKDYYFAMDNGEKIYPADTTNLYKYKITEGQRAYVFFNELEEKKSGYDYNAIIYNVVDVLTKDIIPLTEETADSIGDDAINAPYYWLAGGHLNIQFQLLGTNSPSNPHMLNLVENKTIEYENDDYMHLEFRHNAHNDVEAKLREGVVCFRVDYEKLKDEWKGIKMRVKTIYDGEKIIKIDFSEITNRGQRALNPQTGSSAAPLNTY